MTPTKYIEIVAKRHNHWIGVARFYGSKHPEDDVQDAYIKALEYVTKNGVDEGVNPDGLMFFCTRSCALAIDDKMRHSYNFDDLVGEEIAGEVGYNGHIDDERYELIHKEIESWDWFDRTLFKVYFDMDRKNNGKMSMRKLASETKIALPTIFLTIKECKQRIKSVFE